VEWADEDREPAEEELFRRAEQVVGPADGGPQRPVPLGTGPPPANQQTQVVVEAAQQVRGGEAGRPGGGQLHGQRDAIETAADPRDVMAAGVGVEGGRTRRRTLAEQLGTGPAGF